MAEAASAQQAASATAEDTSQPRAGRRRRTSAEPQRAQQGATAAAAPATLDTLSRLQQLADASPQAAQLRRLQALADASSQVAQLRRLQALADASPQVAQLRRLQALADASPQAAQLRRLQALADAHYAPVSQLAGDPEEEEPIQGQFASSELSPQCQQAPRANNTGLPDQLKSGIESLSGLSMDHVRVHYNSSQPAQLNALAYAQGSDIHLAPGQERHLPHEAWHVVQQAQGRVRPTLQMQEGVPVNDDVGLEREADAMGGRALQACDIQRSSEQPPASSPGGAIQAMPVGGALAVMQLVRAEIAPPQSFSLANLRLFKTAIDLELEQIADEINNESLTEENQKNVKLWLGLYDKKIVELEKLNPGDASFTWPELQLPSTNIQIAMRAVAIPLGMLRKVLNESFAKYNTWKENQELEKAARDKYASYDKKDEKKKPAKKEPQKTPTKQGPTGLGTKWGNHNKALKALEGNTRFCQLVPEGATTITKSIKSQDILDAVFHPGKAFWMAAEKSDYRLAASKGKVMMIYTFTPDGAKSLMQDYLICGSGDYAKDNEEEWKGEACHPNYTIWKTNEIGAYGVGANRLKTLKSQCIKIEQAKT